MQPPVHIEQCV